jgi:hypothetical protein
MSLVFAGSTRMAAISACTLAQKTRTAGRCHPNLRLNEILLTTMDPLIDHRNLVSRESFSANDKAWGEDVDSAATLQSVDHESTVLLMFDRPSAVRIFCVKDMPLCFTTSPSNVRPSVMSKRRVECRKPSVFRR